MTRPHNLCLQPKIWLGIRQNRKILISYTPTFQESLLPPCLHPSTHVEMKVNTLQIVDSERTHMAAQIPYPSLNNGVYSIPPPPHPLPEPTLLSREHDKVCCSTHPSLLLSLLSYILHTTLRCQGLAGAKIGSPLPPNGAVCTLRREGGRAKVRIQSGIQ